MRTKKRDWQNINDAMESLELEDKAIIIQSIESLLDGLKKRIRKRADDDGRLFTSQISFEIELTKPNK